MFGVDETCGVPHRSNCTTTEHPRRLLFRSDSFNTCGHSKLTKRRLAANIVESCTEKSRRSGPEGAMMKYASAFLLLIFLASGPTFAQRAKKTEPCAKATSQADMNDCWGKQYKAADVTLNQVYRQLVALLDEEEKAQLKEVQMAWLKYRDTNCEFVADSYKGGSMRPMAHAICLAEVTGTRTTELRTQIKDRNR
jgi:uncharacterized protein YecT (DUF1311 family)